MLSPRFEVSASSVERAARALASVPRAAYSVPHVYPSAAPAYTEAPRAPRPAVAADALRLYAHVPFCRYHCTFCYFAVRVGASADTMARYVRALERELAWIEPGTPLSQLFVGGGTPTALPAELLDALLTAIFRRTTRAPGDSVHTVETSPETISPAHAEVLRRHGVGRVSMGVQSLDEEVLDAVHRRQTRARALEACALLVDAGMIVNVDLIYGLPGQSPEGFRRDLAEVAALGVHAFTAYSLRINERTTVTRALAAGDPFDLRSLMEWRAFVEACAAELGYTQTRWHTFKRLDGIARRHERLPCFDDAMSGYQLGVGMSARSHLGHTVYRNHEQLPVYLERIERDESPVQQVFPLAEPDRVTQAIARSLGDGRPLARAHYQRLFGRPIEDDFGPLLAGLAAGGLLDDDGETLALSRTGRLVYDLVMLAFYPQRARDWLAAREPRAAFVQLPAAPA